MSQKYPIKFDILWYW